MAVNENKFYKALEDIFVGAPIEGEGGYVNLLSIKQKYYSNVIECLKNDISKDSIISDSFKEDFYNLLYSFFEKYFSECGSVYFVKTANWQRVYEKVYTDTKDVVLFWKTHMLYYVKSDILFQSIYIKAKDDKDDTQYVFYFDVGELQQKQNNEKKELVFSFKETKTGRIADIHDEETGDKTFVLSVNYSKNGRKTKFDSLVRSMGIKQEVIEKAISTFKKQTTVDFFINKNAKAFLEEQLDLFLHQLLLEDESVFEQERLNQIKTVKKYAKNIIAFISQFENELVRIWNKPKFVKNSNYVISIDKLNNEIIEKIRNHDGLPAQIEEWKELEIVDDGFLFDTSEIVKHSHLPIDTKYFKDLELEILSQFDDLSKELNGILIHSENYQALNTIKNRYNNSVQCIYIDPPFNTGTDFMFVDDYQDSTWLSIINDRLDVSKHLLRENGSYYVELDHIAEHYGKQLLDNHFGVENYLGKITWNTGDNISGFKSQAKYWIRQADYIHFYVKNSTGDKKYKFTKVYEPLDKQAFSAALGVSSSWLDLLSKEKNKYYIEKWDKDELKEIPVDVKAKAKGTIWNDIYSFQLSEPRETESISFASNQKPENLLRRILQSSTDQNDLVLDFFAGSGTTCAVAHKLNRTWLGVEMGEYFYETYQDVIEFNKKKSNNDEKGNSNEKDLLKNFNTKCIIETISETESKVKYLIKKIGLLGRMKIVINGDKQFISINSLITRKPHLSNDIDWPGGGFFKYYELEQYEDTLGKARYSPENKDLFASDPFSQYIFFADQKLTDVLDVCEEGVSLDFDKLYENIDFPETISLLYGEPIEKITEDEVKLAHIEKPIKYNVAKMDDAEKVAFVKLLKPLLWWGE